MTRNYPKVMAFVLIFLCGLLLLSTTLILTSMRNPNESDKIDISKTTDEPIKASIDIPSIVIVPVKEEVKEEPKEYIPTFNDHYNYILNENKIAVREGFPKLTDSEIKRIIRAIERYSVEYNVNKNTIFSIVQVESHYIIRVNSHKGAKYGRGLLQVSEVALNDFNLWTGKEYTKDDLYIIEKNIEVGIWAFQQNYRYGVEKNFEHGAIIAYNVGVGDYKANKKDLLNAEFKGNDYNYLKKVKTQYDILCKVNNYDR